MTRHALALDHFIFPVLDIDAVAAAWQRLGFIVMPAMKHEALGSWNRVIQFEHTYLEILGRFECAVPALRDVFTPLVERREGLAFIGFNTDDIEIERARVLSEGVEIGQKNDARRKVVLPDGGEDETASSSASARFADRPLMTLFYSEHRRPQAIWQAGYQAHANGVKRVSAVVWSSNPSPPERAYFRTMLNADPVEVRSERTAYVTRREEDLLILGDTELQSRFGDLAPEKDAEFTSRPVALEFQVRDLVALKNLLGTNGVEHAVTGNAVIVPEAETHGVVLRFHE